MPLLLTVEPLQRADLVETGESQLDQSVSSTESKPSGVQENCFPLPVFGFSSGVLLAWDEVDVAVLEPSLLLVLVWVVVSWFGLLVSCSRALAMDVDKGRCDWPLTGSSPTVIWRISSTKARKGRRQRTLHFAGTVVARTSVSIGSGW
jgi:hypothetical protein